MALLCEVEAWVVAGPGLLKMGKLFFLQLWLII